MKKLDDKTILETNRLCYDTLGANYTDGPRDLEIIKQNGIWQQFIDGLPKDGKKILNVGCGTGDASVWLAEHGYDVTSTDIAPEMVRITAAKTPNSRSIVLGATELDQLDGEKFDGIFAIHVIQHLDKALIEQFFNQARALLSDSGKLLLVFTNNCYSKSGYQPEGSQDGLFTVWYKHNLEDIVPLLNKTHFKPTQFWTQQTIPDACGIACPFAFICQKS